MKILPNIKYQVFSLKKKILAVVFFVFLFNTYFLILNVRVAKAQIFSLNPSTLTKAAGDEFDVDLNIDSQSQAVASADVKITFDSDIVEVVKVTPGTFFSDEADYIGTGKLFVGGFFREPYATKTGNGKLAIITLKGKKGGTAHLSFSCSTEKNDSNILDSSATDIIKCSGIKDGTYTITGSSADPTSTPAPTPTGTKPTAKPTPPTSGATLPTLFFGGAGLLLTIIGIAIIL